MRPRLGPDDSAVRPSRLHDVHCMTHFCVEMKKKKMMVKSCSDSKRWLLLDKARLSKFALADHATINLIDKNHRRKVSKIL